MRLEQEIAEPVSQLPRSKQEQVLRFVSELGGQAPIGEKGSDLAAFQGRLDPVSAQEMRDAIEKDCGQTLMSGSFLLDTNIVIAFLEDKIQVHAELN